MFKQKAQLLIYFLEDFNLTVKMIKFELFSLPLHCVRLNLLNKNHQFLRVVPFTLNFGTHLNLVAHDKYEVKL